jgi:putative sterol carrier protein
MTSAIPPVTTTRAIRAGQEIDDVTPETDDDAATFFEALGRRGREPLLAKASGTIRFDLVGDGKLTHWLVRLDGGDVAVSRRRSSADCVVRADKALFDACARGEANAMAAMLRGELTFEGDPELLARFQRILPAAREARE